LTNVMSWVFALSVASAGHPGGAVDAGYLEPHYAVAHTYLQFPKSGVSIAFDNAGYVDAPDGRYWLKRIEFSPEEGRTARGFRLVHEDSHGNVLSLLVRCNARQHGMLQNLFVDLLVPQPKSSPVGHVVDIKTLFPQGQPRFMSRKLASEETGGGLMASTWQAVMPKTGAI